MQQQRRVLVLAMLRNTAPLVPEYRHPLARFSFRTVYADSANKGRFSQKHLGILGEPGALRVTARRLREDADEPQEPTEREREERTLDELRFVFGDYLLVAVLLPKSVGGEGRLRRWRDLELGGVEVIGGAIRMDRSPGGWKGPGWTRGQGSWAR